MSVSTVNRAAIRRELSLRRVVDLVAERGGVARTPTLLEAGVSRHELSSALNSGAVLRVRRGWVALPGADMYLVAAARTGVVLTCVTQAQRLGLWVMDASRPHVAAGSHSGRLPTEKATVHWARPAVPRHPDSLVDPVENVLITVASCRPFEEALVVWESAFNKRLVSKKSMSRLPLSGAAARICEVATPFSDSGLETFVLVRLRWLPIAVVPQVWIEGHAVDFLIGERLILQVDGGHHVGSQRTSDIQHDATLMLLGYHVIRVGYDQVVNTWPEVQQILLRAIAQGLHLAP